MRTFACHVRELSFTISSTIIDSWHNILTAHHCAHAIKGVQVKHLHNLHVETNAKKVAIELLITDRIHLNLLRIGRILYAEIVQVMKINELLLVIVPPLVLNLSTTRHV